VRRHYITRSVSLYRYIAPRRAMCQREWLFARGGTYGEPD